MCLLQMSALTACTAAPEEKADYIESSAPDTAEPIAAEAITARITMDTAEETESSTVSVMQCVIDEPVFPEVNSIEGLTKDEIMFVGKAMALYYKEAVRQYFGYGAEHSWKIDYENTRDDGYKGEYMTGGVYHKILGAYNGFDSSEAEAYEPMNSGEAESFIINDIKLTKNGYDELCRNSPSGYMNADDFLWVSSGDGGNAGWDYSCIIDCEYDESTVTYSCIRVGDAEVWGYDEDMIKPFTFRLAEDNGVWKLDGCSYTEGLLDLVGLEGDAPTAASEDAE